MIFGTGDVAEDRVLARLFVHQESHRHAGDRRLQRHACIHHRVEPPHTEAIDEDPLDSRMSETTRTV